MIEGGEKRAIGGTGHGGLLPSTDDVVYVTGGLHSCSGPTGLGGVPRSADAEIANPFVLTFLDSGALLKCVHRFSGRAFWQGTVGVAVRGIEHGLCSGHVDPVPAAFTPGPASQTRLRLVVSPSCRFCEPGLQGSYQLPDRNLARGDAFGALIRASGPSSRALPRRSWSGGHDLVGFVRNFHTPLALWAGGTVTRSPS